MTDKQRTNAQNRALHLFCRLLSKTLNDAGLDQRTVLKETVEIPWNEESVKESLFKPVEKAMFGHDSTTEADTTDYSKVHEVLVRHLADKFGVQVPAWPDRNREDLR
jgi:hypothetical protein